MNDCSFLFPLVCRSSSVEESQEINVVCESQCLLWEGNYKLKSIVTTPSFLELPGAYLIAFACSIATLIRHLF